MVKAQTIFYPGQFSATKYDSAEDKAKTANGLVRFLANGCQRPAFTARIYQALSLHMFGHIAEYNIDGFYATWFGTPQACAAWVTYVLRGGAYGFHDQGWGDGWGDVESAVAAWLKASGVADAILHLGETSTEASERAELARLREKYPR